MFSKWDAAEPFFDGPRIVCHSDYPLADLERLDLLRFAKIHLAEARHSLEDYERHWGKESLAKAFADRTSTQSRHRDAATAVRAALDAHELHGEDFECVEQALRPLAKVTYENRFGFLDSTAKQNRCRRLDIGTQAMFARLEAMPIDVPVFANRIRPPTL
jgi:hypothetical protein